MVRGAPHGVPTYGYTQKWEDFPVVFENQCQNESVTTKTFDSYGYKNFFRCILYLTILVAFRNKWSRGSHGIPTYGYIRKWEDFPVVYENSCQNESVTTYVGLDHLLRNAFIIFRYSMDYYRFLYPLESNVFVVTLSFWHLFS